MYTLIHKFQLVVVSTGLSNLLSLAPFLDDVIYEPIRTGTLAWPVAFELMILYLRKVENNPSEYRLGNVVGKCGAMDMMAKSASVMAEGLYPAKFFRPGRGEPRDVDDKDKDKKKDKKEVYTFTSSTDAYKILLFKSEYGKLNFAFCRMSKCHCFAVNDL